MASAPLPDLLTPLTSLAEVAHVPSKARAMLAKAGIMTVGDLLHHFPRRYEDRRCFPGFPLEETPGAVCIHGVVSDCRLRRMGFRKVVEVVVEDAACHPLAGPICCRWFQGTWMIKAMAVGQVIVLYGRVKTASRGKGLVMDHPDFEIIEDDESGTSEHMGRIVPVYRLGDGLAQKPLRAAVHTVLESLDDLSIEECLPPGERLARGAVTHRAAALRCIHFPASADEAAAARHWLAMEEFFHLQVAVLRRRARSWARTRTRTDVMHGPDDRLYGPWLARLPFPLTSAQSRSIEEIRGDLCARRPMNRLLQGDVGSGKTMVAMAAAVMAAECGHQTAVLAPTQILAEQHYFNFLHHLAPLGLRVGLRTAARRPSAIDGSDSPHVLIGTHALLYGDTRFQSLGLVVIDEQHKFGVAQRTRLAAHASAPDVLIMTATPIPRTLALTLYGDLDVSILDEAPAGRGKIITAVRQGPDLTQVTAFIRQQLAKGRQAYIVYPLIEESDSLAIQAATTEWAAWQERLPEVAIGLLHGRLKPEAKAAVMEDFRSGAARVLVSTTVIEVGVDVPNANLMLVFHAERFGLAQLHQLRGRIGRGPHTSYCVLICSDHAEGALDRLRVLEQTRDGFEIAEADLRLRGPGELLGHQQSGVPGLQLGDLVADAALVHRARELAEAVMHLDPELIDPRHRVLRCAVDAIEAAPDIAS